MRQITVTMNQLENCAMRMDEDNQAYIRSYEQLFEAIESMSNAWQGVDNNAFVSKITSYASDFKQMSLLCSEYSEFLKNTARSYRSTQEELANQAGLL